MRSPESPSESSTSSAGPSRPINTTSSRSILSFWGNNNDTTINTSASPIPPLPPKNKRRKTDEVNQGRLLLKSDNGGVWSIGSSITKDDTDGAGSDARSSTPTVGAGKKVRKRKEDPEEAERKEMVRKAKEAKKILAAQEKAAKALAQSTKVKDRGKGKGKQRDAASVVEGQISNDRYTESDDELDLLRSDHDDALINGVDILSRNPFSLSPMKVKSSHSHQPSLDKRPSPTKRNNHRKTFVHSVADPPSPRARHRSSSPSDIVVTGHRKPLLAPTKAGALHPFFSRTSSRNSRASSAEKSEQKEESELQPDPSWRPLSSPLGGQTLNSLFAKTNSSPDVFEMARSESNGTKADRMTPKTAAQGPGVETEKAVHSFFSNKGSAGAVRLRDGWGGDVKEGTEPRAVLPGGSWPSHSGGEAGVPQVIDIPLKKKKRNPPDTGGAHGSLSHLVRSDGTSIQRSLGKRVHAEQSQPFVTSHPAVASILGHSTSSNRETWCELHRPRQASEVLGNEIEATYLRDWLSALSVTKDGEPNRKVIRKVVARKKSNLVDGFIVDDIGLYGSAVEAEDDRDEDEGEIMEEIEEPLLTFGQRQNFYPNIENRLTNCIMLSGPSGVGKTAAVYAVAAELGWEIFEVYPGIGKRTGGSLMTLVGDVGKNHMVITGKSGKVRSGPDKSNGKTGPLQSFFGKASVVPKFNANGNGHSSDNAIPIEAEILHLGSQGSATEPIEIDHPNDEDPKCESEKENVSTPLEEIHNIRQSLILIDDVDILFEDESTFWPAIVSLVAESKRPVVLIANEPPTSLINQLPLQASLRFLSPPSYLAIPHLEAIAESHNIHPGNAVDVYHGSMSTSYVEIDQPLPPNGHEPIPYFDLRRAITQMQLDRTIVDTIPTSDLQTAQGQINFEEVIKTVEMLSFVDAYVDHRFTSRMEINEIDRYDVGGPDDEIGILGLVKPAVDDLQTSLAGYDHSDEISFYLRNSVDAGVTIKPLRKDLPSDRAFYIHSLLPVLDPLIPLSSYLLPHQTLFTEVLPVLREIVEADDVLQAEDDARLAEGVGRVNKKTGRPVRLTALGREGYVRYLDVDGMEHVVRDSGFRV